MPEEAVSLVRRGKLDIRCAGSVDLPAVLELIDEAKLWLPSKYTDQWSKDWADQKGRKRSERVQASLAQGTTWIVTVTHEKQTYAVATVTIEPKANPLVWDRPGELDDSAVYLSRLVVARRFAGLKIGAAVLNWACNHARHQHKAKLVRIDVWTRNFGLHRYYLKQGFWKAGKCSDESYPSRQRFERPTGKIAPFTHCFKGSSSRAFRSQAALCGFRIAKSCILSPVGRRQRLVRLDCDMSGEHLAA